LERGLPVVLRLIRCLQGFLALRFEIEAPQSGRLSHNTNHGSLYIS
jgi:hypothetical protein